MVLDFLLSKLLTSISAATHPPISSLSAIYTVYNIIFYASLSGVSNILIIMPPKKRVSTTSTAPKKRAQVAAPSRSASQPILVNTQQLPDPPSPSPTLLSRLHEALPNALQATFESQLRDGCSEAEIVAPTKGSEEATVASSDLTDKAAVEGFDQEYEDDYDGIDWLRLPRFTKPLTTSRRKPSWIYQHGYRVVLLANTDQMYFVCRYCHIHKYIDTGRGGVFPSTATTAAARHLGEA
jgi:hypothetical protein